VIAPLKGCATSECDPRDRTPEGVRYFGESCMDHLTSPKLTPGVHCLNLRHKGMYVTTGPDPDEFTFYDRYDSTAYWCVETQRGFGPDGDPVRPDCCSGERACCKH
jgi:hypothetical protein